MAKTKTFLKLRSFLTLHCLNQEILAEWLGLAVSGINMRLNQEKLTHYEQKIILSHLQDYDSKVDCTIFFD